MKKNYWFMILVIFLMAIIFTFGCNAYAEVIENELEVSESVIDTNNQALLEKYNFEEIPSREEFWDKYWRKVVEAYYCTYENEHFLDTDTYNFFQELGYEIISDDGITVMLYNDILYTYNFPVVFEGENCVELYHVSNQGTLWSKNLVGESNVECYGNVHVSPYEFDNIILTDKVYTVTYTYSTGSVKTWQFGKIIKETYVPEESMYAGFSASEGLIFHKEKDVYAVHKFGYFRKDETDAEVIAHNVDIVIVTDYSSIDCYSTPLFMMEDGSVKYYCRVGDAQADYEENLHQLTSERRIKK